MPFKSDFLKEAGAWGRIDDIPIERVGKLASLVENRKLPQVSPTRGQTKCLGVSRIIRIELSIFKVKMKANLEVRARVSWEYMNRPSCSKCMAWKFKTLRFLKIGSVYASKWDLDIILTTRLCKITTETNKVSFVSWGPNCVAIKKIRIG